jgi:hypothetical protein
MRKVLLTLSAATIALAAAPLQAQGRGHGGQGNQDQGRGHGAQRGDDHGNRGRGGGEARQGRGHDDRAEHRGRGNAQRADGDDHRGRGHDRADRGRGRDHAENRGRGNDRRGPVEVRNGDVLLPGVRQDDRGRGRGRGNVERRAALVTNQADIVRVRTVPGRGLVNGCPPGLARRNNGCLPPGHARRLAERSWANSLIPQRYRDGNYAYADGYLLRLAPTGAVQGFVPLAGGALWRGNPWPTGYDYAPVPTYFSQYYGWNQPYDYRYADGIVYGLDPQTQMIQQVAGLLTGDQWNIGQAMPTGYDIYNVPYDYRAQYYDTPQSLYRYSDGYVYQVDPTTQLIQAAISLIA